MKCLVCGAEMTHLVGGCWQCDNCKIGGINDLVLRFPNDATWQGKPDAEELPQKVELGPRINPRSSEEAIKAELAKHDKKALSFLLDEYIKFIENYRKNILSLTVAPEISAVKARDLDLQLFNDFAGDFMDTLCAYFDGPPCEGWTKGSDCRECPMTDCYGNRIHSKLFKTKE